MSITTQIFEIFFRKRPPHDINYSPNAAILLFAFAVLFSYAGYKVQPIFSQPFLYGFASELLQTVALYGVFIWLNKESRFIQALTATLGMYMIFQGIALAATYVPPLIFITLPAFFWGSYLIVVIIKEALEISFVKAIFVLILTKFAMIGLMILVLPNLNTELNGVLEQIIEQMEAARIEAEAQTK